MTKKSLIRRSVSVFLLLASAFTANAITLVNSASFEGSEYRVYTEDAISWTESNAAAAALGNGWRLVSITSSAENSFVESLLAGLTGDRYHFFIGLTDLATEGSYEWTSGEAYTFSDWWGGEPNGGTNENYVGYDFRGDHWAWNDLPDDGYPNLQKGFIAERVPDAGSTLALLGGAVALLGLVRRRMK